MRIILPFALGVILEAQWRVLLWWLPLVAVGLCLALLAVHTYFVKKKRMMLKPHFGAGVLLCFFLLGFGLCQQSISSFHDQHYSKAGTYNGMVCQLLEMPIKKTKSLKVEMEVIGLIQDSLFTGHKGEILCYIQQDSSSVALEVGQRILISKKAQAISPTKNPKEFDYRKYLFGKGIYEQIYLRKEDFEILDNGKRHGVLSHFAAWRVYLLDELRAAGISERSFGVIAALVLGMKHDLDKELFESYASAGAMHVLAVSGLHVGIIYGILLLLTQWLSKGKRRQWIRLTFILLALWGYAAITGLSASVLRATTMFSVIAISKTLDRKSNIYNTLAISALILMVVHPFIIMEVGFQLSYAAVIGIVYFQPKIYDLWQPKSWVLDKIWALSAVSFSAQLATFPIGMLYFHQFPNYFLVSNLIVIPAATIILGLGLAFFVFHWLHPVNVLLANLLEFIVASLNNTIGKMEMLPFPRTTGISISVSGTYVLYALILAIAFTLIYKSSKWMLASLAIGTLSIFLLTSRELALKKEEVVVHYIPKHFAVSICKDGEAAVLYSNGLKDKSDKIRFHLQNYWDSKGIESVAWYAIDSLSSDSVYKNDHFLFWNGHLVSQNASFQLVNRRWESAEQNDTALKIAFGRQHKGVYEQLESGSKLWLGPSISRKTKEKMREKWLTRASTLVLADKALVLSSP